MLHINFVLITESNPKISNSTTFYKIKIYNVRGIQYKCVHLFAKINCIHDLNNTVLNMLIVSK